MSHWEDNAGGLSVRMAEFPPVLAIFAHTPGIGLDSGGPGRRSIMRTMSETTIRRARWRPPPLPRRRRVWMQSEARTGRAFAPRKIRSRAPSRCPRPVPRPTAAGPRVVRADAAHARPAGSRARADRGACRVRDRRRDGAARARHTRRRMVSRGSFRRGRSNPRRDAGLSRGGSARRANRVTRQSGRRRAR